MGTLLWIPVKKNPTLRQFVWTLDFQDGLDPRDSFFGGWTNAVKLHYKATGNETIHYYDFTSIYPRTNTYCRYPVGHPTIITDDFKDFSEYFGVAKVTILPHRALYHACLPYLSNQKLKFPLCKKCADTENQNECHCSIHERSITGTWCTPEIQMAISKGYQILKIQEVYHFEQSSQYNRVSGTGGLFAQYVNTFLKIKQRPRAFLLSVTRRRQRSNTLENTKKKKALF